MPFVAHATRYTVATNIEEGEHLSTRWGSWVYLTYPNTDMEKKRKFNYTMNKSAWFTAIIRDACYDRQNVALFA